uniref:Uncharacterized protein n=1 Tax=viral metagenome TaxID=1070528 RepID=A0A6M3XS62_9ZZZZ
MKKYIQILMISLILLWTYLSFAGGGSTSGKTVANLITETRYILNESTASMWSDAELTAWINDAVRNISARTHCLESGNTRHVLSSGTSEYSIGSNYIFVKGVIYQSGSTTFKALKRGKILDVGNMTGEEPSSYYEFNGKVGIYPLVDSDNTSVSGNTIYILAVTLPDTLTSLSTIPTPAAYDRAIIYYVVSQALLKDNRDGRAQTFLNQYYSEIDRFRVDNEEMEQSMWDVFYPKKQMDSTQPTQ